MNTQVQFRDIFEIMKNSCEHAPEVWMGAFSQLVNIFFKRPASPFNSEMDVLKQHPTAIFMCMCQVTHSNGLLHGESR